MNPVPKTGLKKARSRSLLFFTDDQIQKIKNAVMPRELWLCIQLLYYCFIRPGESRLLKIGDLNIQYGFIEIPAEVSKNKKTQKVSIPVPLRSSLEYLSKYPDNYYLLGFEGIPSIDPIPEKRLYHIHKRILSNVEIYGRYSLYSWKHTGVVKAVKAGINIKDLQMQLRHHSLDMVSQVSFFDASSGCNTSVFYSQYRIGFGVRGSPCRFNERGFKIL
ncbi:MAG: site-specific integrase, partial [Niabella sp.]